jgi:predicted transcriptional regulator
MNTEQLLTPIKATIEKASLTETIKRIEENCKNCKPLSMLECVGSCNTWKLKNEFRELYKRMQNPDFMTHLLNTLKNKRRLQILKMISEGHYTTPRIQQELKELGYHHSQETITEEYITPLLDIELATEAQSRYRATTFGSRIVELTRNLDNIEDALPSHSECYEETALVALLDKPKTYEDVRSTIPTRNIARILSRLQKTGLVETSKEKDYVFFFRSRRPQSKETLSPTEKRIYRNILEKGISARKLAEKTEISVRRAYKYLRRLKGKKMVFTREKPKAYSLTAKGLQTALTLQRIHDVSAEILATATQLFKDEETPKPFSPDIHQKEHEKKEQNHGFVNGNTMR